MAKNPQEHGEVARRLTATTPTAAAMLNLGQHRIRALVREGKLKALRSGRRFVIPISELERYAREGAE